MKTFAFDHEPSFAELWEVCVYNLMYDVARYCDDIEKMFAYIGITNTSRIIDVAGGGGFPALDLAARGFTIDCIDGFSDEVVLFNQRAEERGVSTRCKQVLWSELPGAFSSQTHDFMFCRGNSFIYAGGGWNELVEINKQSALKKYRDTAKIFFDLLKPGGYLYIDKFKDSEVSHKETVAQIRVNSGEPEDLIFWTERFPEKKIRRASMIRRKTDGSESGIPNITYDLTFPELEEILKEAGFSSVETLAIPSEHYFDIRIARK